MSQMSNKRRVEELESEVGGLQLELAVANARAQHAERWLEFYGLKELLADVYAPGANTPDEIRAHVDRLKAEFDRVKATHEEVRNLRRLMADPRSQPRPPVPEIVTFETHPKVMP